MALSRLVLMKGLVSLFDGDSFPDSYEGAAENFSKVINDYALSIVPTSVNFEFAREEFVSSFVENRNKESIEILIDAVKWYCGVLTMGMQTPGYVVYSPTENIALTTGMIAVSERSKLGMSGEDWADAVSQIIDSYFRTGKVLQVETGVVTPWS